MLKHLPAGEFDPETVDILVGAFDDAWTTARASGAPIASEDYAVRGREILAKAIIEMAASGERDRHTLAEGALFQLSRSQMRKSDGRAGK
jgi:hypothetical protein